MSERWVMLSDERHGIFVMEAGGDYVAAVNTMVCGTSEAERRARLMAAAPRLLSVCQSSADALRDFGTARSQDDLILAQSKLGAVERELRTAIAQAAGDPTPPQPGRCFEQPNV